MRCLSIAALLIAGPACMPQALAQAGSPDPTFGVDGRVVLPIGLDPRASAAAVALQPDGGIVVAGTTRTDRCLVARFTPSGAVDLSFGQGGSTLIRPAGLDCRFFAVSIQPDGRAVAVGETRYASAPQSAFFLAARFNADGSPDTSFGIGGFVQINVDPEPSTADVALALEIQADGRIVIGGRSSEAGDLAIVRLLPSGMLDSSFGSGGIVIQRRPLAQEAAAVRIGPDGFIVAAGRSSVVRFSGEGSIDSTFGSNGVVDLVIQSAAPVLSDLSLRSDGRIVATGTSAGAFAAVRLLPTGAFDPTFGAGGVSIVEFDLPVLARAAVLTEAGAITLAGETDTFSTDDFALARLLPDGTPDLAFGEEGRVVTSVVSNRDAAYGVALDTEGRTVAAGLADQRIAVARFSGSGWLDPTFANGGISLTGPPVPDDSRVTAVATLADGRVLVGGPAEPHVQSSLLRLVPGGGVDSTFGSDGVAIMPIEGDMPDLMLDHADRVLVAIGGVVIRLARLLPDGTLDSTFGSNGIVTTVPPPYGMPDYGSRAAAIDLLPDGRIALAGVQFTWEFTGHQESLVVAVYLPDGTLDTSFDGGVVVTRIGGRAVGTSIDADLVGRFVVGGSVMGQAAVLRYLPDGSLDPGFGSGGVVTVLPGVSGSVESLRVLTDERIVVSGWMPGAPAGTQGLVARLLPDGSLDDSFGNGGIAVTPEIPATGISSAFPLDDNRVVTAGHAGGAMHFVVYTAAGLPDPTFGEGGVATIPFSEGLAGLADAALDSNGRIIGGGHVRALIDNRLVDHFALARILGPLTTSSPSPPPAAGTALHPPAPNPARRESRVSYTLAYAGPVRIAVLDMLGREVLDVFDGHVARGTHERIVDTWSLSPGTYLVRLYADGGLHVQPLTVSR